MRSVLAALAASSLLTGWTAEKPVTRPDFVVIMVDDMGYAGVSCFGNPYFRTPEIDRLATEGMRLTDFHSSGTVYEGGHNVPCIAWWPGRVSAGSTNDTPAITLDVMPTLLSLAGVSPPGQRPLDGVDLSPVLLHDKELPPRPLFWASLSNGGSRLEAMRDGPWKLVMRHPGARPGSFRNESVELYRLDTDPGEMTDLAGSEPQQANSMLARLKEWYADTRKNATPQPGGW